YNNTLGWLTDIVAYWSPYPNPSQPGSDVIELNTSWGSTAGVRAAGSGVTTARIAYYIGYSGVTLVNDTGPLRVSVSNVDSVVIRTSRGGFGTWVGNTIYDVYQTDTYWAAAYNATQGYLGDIVSNWASTDPR